MALLESFCAAQLWTYEILTDVGSGLNYQKRGLRQLINRICSGEVGRLVLSHKDRLLRFGSELVFSLCEHFSVEVIIINASDDSTFEEDLANDVIENDVIENDVIENDVIENDVIENDVIENDVIENDVIENDVIENDVIENNVIENDVIENDVIEKDVIEIVTVFSARLL